MLEKLEEIRRKYEEIRSRLADPEFVVDHRAVREAQKTLAEFEPIVSQIDERARIVRELQGARELTESLAPGDELYQMAAAERSALTARLETIDQELKVLLLPRDPNDSRNVFLEIRAEPAARKRRSLPGSSSACTNGTRSAAGGRSRSWTATTRASAA